MSSTSPTVLAEPAAPGGTFGGRWTDEKLEKLGKYLAAYRTIFTSNRRAAMLTTIYVDAFAGTGHRLSRKAEEAPALPFMKDAEATAFRKGSARIALEVEPPFDEYMFIERSPRRVRELAALRDEFQSKGRRVRVMRGEANACLRRWCATVDWTRNRAVVFLDPYGMQVEWVTIQALAATKAVDLWLLFPLGQAVSRLLTRSEPPTGAWAKRLSLFFGSDDWKSALYRKPGQADLFGQEERAQRAAGIDAIGRYFIKRLEAIFAGVAPNPLPLLNSRKVPIYLLCFAAGNPRGAPTAVKIAGDILGRR